MDIVLYLLMIKKKTVKKSEIWVKFSTIGCVFYRVGDWDDLQIGLHFRLHDGFKLQFAGIVPVFRVHWHTNTDQEKTKNKMANCNSLASSTSYPLHHLYRLPLLGIQECC